MEIRIDTVERGGDTVGSVQLFGKCKLYYGFFFFLIFISTLITILILLSSHCIMDVLIVSVHLLIPLRTFLKAASTKSRTL